MDINTGQAIVLAAVGVLGIGFCFASIAESWKNDLVSFIDLITGRY